MKRILLIATAVATVGSVSAKPLFWPYSDGIGCATIAAVQPTKQAPIYNSEYKQRYQSTSSGNEIGAIAVGAGTSLVKSVVLDAAANVAVNAVKDKPYQVVTPPEGFKNVVAVTFQLDGGKKLSMPVLHKQFPTNPGDREYKVGDRVVLTYSSESQTFVVSPPIYSTPEPGKGVCVKGRTATEVEALLATNANLVDESLFITEETSK